MEHAAMSIGADPLEFRLKNIDNAPGVPNEEGMALKMIELAKSRAKYDSRVREIQAFNEVNLKM